MKTYRFRVRMAQKMGFPTDMLRYDSCWPASSDDAVKLAVAVRSPQDWQHFYVESPARITTIELMSTAKVPSRGRWLSFGWEVV